jgi:hypothetical protein
MYLSRYIDVCILCVYVCFCVCITKYIHVRWVTGTKCIYEGGAQGPRPHSRRAQGKDGRDVEAAGGGQGTADAGAGGQGGGTAQRPGKPRRGAARIDAGTAITCFTGTKVCILT